MYILVNGKFVKDDGQKPRKPEIMESKSKPERENKRHVKASEGTGGDD